MGVQQWNESDLPRWVVVQLSSAAAALEFVTTNNKDAYKTTHGSVNSATIQLQQLLNHTIVFITNSNVNY